MRDFSDFGPNQLDALLAPELDPSGFETVPAAQLEAEKLAQLLAVSQLLRDRSRVLLGFSDSLKERAHLSRHDSRALSFGGAPRS